MAQNPFVTNDGIALQQIEIREGRYKIFKVPSGWSTHSFSVDGVPHVSYSKPGVTIIEFAGHLETDLSEQQKIHEAEIPVLTEQTRIEIQSIKEKSNFPFYEKLVNSIDLIKKFRNDSNDERQRQLQVAHEFYGSDPLSKTQPEILNGLQKRKKYTTRVAVQQLNQSISAAFAVKSLNAIVATIDDEIGALESIKAHYEALVQPGDNSQPGRRTRNGISALEELRREGKLDFIEILSKESMAAAKQSLLTLAIERENQWDEESLALHQAQLEEANRLNAVARIEAERAEAQRNAEAVRHQQIQQNNSYSATSNLLKSRPVFMVGTAGVIASVDSPDYSISQALRDSIKELVRIAAIRSGQFVATFAALALYSPKLGDGELRSRSRFLPIAASAPLSDLMAYDRNTLSMLADSQGTIDMPFRMDNRALEDIRKFFISPTSEAEGNRAVRVRKVDFDPQANTYSFTTAGIPSRTLTWTPASPAGGESSPSSTTPIVDIDIAVYPGGVATPTPPMIEPHPRLEGYQQDDYILVPPDMEPIYIVFQSPRDLPGVVSGKGETVNGTWLDTKNGANGSPIPSTIADILRGQEFISFDAFRQAFWKEVAKNQELIRQFTSANQKHLSQGRSPFAPVSGRQGARRRYELHHTLPISEGGAVYDIDNLRLMTPKAHIEWHTGRIK